MFFDPFFAFYANYKKVADAKAKARSSHASSSYTYTSTTEPKEMTKTIRKVKKPKKYQANFSISKTTFSALPHEARAELVIKGLAEKLAEHLVKDHVAMEDNIIMHTYDFGIELEVLEEVEEEVEEEMITYKGKTITKDEFFHIMRHEAKISASYGMGLPSYGTKASHGKGK